MKFKTFRAIAVVGALGVTALVGISAMNACKSDPIAQQVVGEQMSKMPDETRPVQTGAPVVAVTESIKAPTVQELKTAIGEWLVVHADRGDLRQMKDILPGRSYSAKVVRFKEEDAVKFSDNPSQWSQVRLDLDRDGDDDEKWLLKNGGLYKREVLDSSGRTVSTEYF